MKSYKSSNYVVSVNLSTIVKGILVFVFGLLSIFSLSGILTSLKPEYRITSSSVNHAAEHVSGALLYNVFSMENRAFKGASPVDVELPSVSNLLLRMATNVSFEDPRSFLGRELPGFSIFDGEILVAGEGTDFTNMPFESVPPAEALNPENEARLQNTDKIENPSSGVAPNTNGLTTGDKKTVYLYFTHTRESYLPYLKDENNPDRAHHSQINVTKVGDKLKEELENRGIGTMIDKTDFIDSLSKKGLDYWYAYQESRPAAQAAMADNKDLIYLIDIHRDSLRKDVTTATIKGQPYAKLAFVVGAEHPNYEKNLKLATELHNQLEENYKGISRGVFVKKGSGTNGKFNQDLTANSLLVEFGGVDNTFEELNRSSAALADVFAEYYWQADKVGHVISTPASSQ
ncbi:stage II sporulation protein P [Bacillus sp. SG-1]|uniref:stage II sporulation protein P n=1 Tax=Bacillus sp. SG-1 TaxID=161544 RepID=UPI0001545075|nr:stage II sporulation protein P [Bacillus sp. SG-1]EDL63717.1 stage II sporulation protein P (septal wall dissolution protein) [Bacillus sp. SG-1]